MLWEFLLLATAAAASFAAAAAAAATATAPLLDKLSWKDLTNNITF